ncbi:MAG: GntR family transcriptional regulator [Bacillota bacterium]
MSLEELTKKEQIINFARNDPFLKISDIAEYVETTPRYVRTILSEANISLMKLREKYARNMEKRLQIKDGEAQKAEIRLINQNYDTYTTDLKFTKLTKQSFRELRKTDPEQELYKVSQKQLVGKGPFGIQEVITYLNSDRITDETKKLDSLYELFGTKSLSKLQFKNNIMQVEAANQVLAQLLEVKSGDPIIKSQRLILIGKIPIAIENCFFAADQVQLILPGEFVI